MEVMQLKWLTFRKKPIEHPSLNKEEFNIDHLNTCSNNLMVFLVYSVI